VCTPNAPAGTELLLANFSKGVISSLRLSLAAFQ
jgi:hypothetical protein